MTPSNDTVDAQEERLCYKQIRIFAESNMGKTGFDTQFPPEARAVMDRLVEIKAAGEFSRLSPDLQSKWMRLHDAHNFIPSGRSVCVAVFGLVSQMASLNGRIGTIRGDIGDAYNPQEGQWRVTFAKYEANGESQDFTLLIHSDNLKTPGGIYRSNSFAEGLFSNRCRMNHACDANTGVMDSGPSAVIIATRLIAEGEELTCNYIGDHTDLSAAQRRDLLKGKYNFLCQCTLCVAGIHV